MLPLMIQIMPTADAIRETSGSGDAVVKPAEDTPETGETLFAQLLAMCCFPVAPVPVEPVLIEGTDQASMPATGLTTTPEISLAMAESDHQDGDTIQHSENASVSILSTADAGSTQSATTILEKTQGDPLLPVLPEKFSGQEESPVGNLAGKYMKAPGRYPVAASPDRLTATSVQILSGYPDEAAKTVQASPKASLSGWDVTVATAGGAEDALRVPQRENLLSVKHALEGLEKSPTPQTAFTRPEVFNGSVPHLNLKGSDVSVEAIVHSLQESNVETNRPGDASRPEKPGVNAIQIPVAGTEKPVATPTVEGAGFSTVPADAGVTVTELPRVLSAMATVAADSGENHAVLRLHPEHLGEVRAEITLKDGGCHVRLLPVLPAAHDALSAQADTLRDALSRQGMATVTVEVSREGFGRGGDQGGRRRPWPEEAGSGKPMVPGLGCLNLNHAPTAGGVAVSRGGLDVKV